jgi:DNA-binding NarL/FixJ family response regulator
LTREQFKQAQSKGQALSLDQAVEYALKLLRRSQTAPEAPKADYDGLTAREREVVRYIVQGKSNREIGDELVLSKRTVEKHVGNILSKLGFTRRAQVVSWAVENGLMKPPG